MGTHETRLFDAMAIADLGPPIRREITPLFKTPIDGLIELAHDERRLGPLGRSLEGSRVGVEHFSTPPRRRHALKVFQKLVNLALLTDLPPAARTAMVVICRGSAGALHRQPLTEHPDHPGWYCLKHDELELHVLETHRLASDGTWGMVRFGSNPRGRAGEPPPNVTAELLGDPLLTTTAREHLMEAIMNQTLPHLTPADTETAAQRMKRLGREEGREEGRAEGRAEGREEGREEGRLEGMIELVADDLTPAQLAHARSIDALPELKAYLKRCLSSGH